MNTSESIGQRIKQVRGELSQKAFGAKIGLSQTAVTALENDQSEPRLGTFNAIIEAFGVNPEWLRTGAGQMKGEPAYRAQLREVGAQVEETSQRVAALVAGSPNMPVQPMTVLRDVEDMTLEGQVAYFKARAEMAEQELAAMKETQRHEKAVQLSSSTGGRSFITASADAADEDYTPPKMTAETINRNVEAPVEPERIHIRRWGNLASLS